MASGKANDFGQLLTDARNGSEQALGELLSRYRRYLLAIANEEIGPNLNAKVAASDVVQETCIATHRDFDRFRGSSERELKSWLRRVLLNQVIGTARMYGDNTKRDVSRELAMHQPSSEDGRSLLSGIQGPGSTPSTQAMRQERAEVLQKVLADLPPDQSEVIVRRSIEQESFEAIGQSLGRTPDAVRMQWRRAFSKLVEQMTSENV